MHLRAAYPLMVGPPPSSPFASTTWPSLSCCYMPSDERRQLGPPGVASEAVGLSIGLHSMDDVTRWSPPQIIRTLTHSTVLISIIESVIARAARNTLFIARSCSSQTKSSQVLIHTQLLGDTMLRGTPGCSRSTRLTQTCSHSPSGTLKHACMTACSTMGRATMQPVHKS